jgi:2-oxoisovalerate dehydrogenase E1 component beta subunit
MAMKVLWEVGRKRSGAVGIGGRSRGFAECAAAAMGVAERREGGRGGGGDTKAVNLFTAVNQALHIALDTDPRSAPCPFLVRLDALFCQSVHR